MNFCKKSIMLFVKIQILFLLLIIPSCVTTKFGVFNDDLILKSSESNNVLKEINIPYSSFIHGIPVKGDKVGILGTAVSPDNSTLFVVINFPKFAILSTKDDGVTFQSSIFDTSYFNSDSDEDEQNRGYKTKVRKDIRVRSAFNNNNVVLSVGPFLFISLDSGKTFKKKTLFYDLDRSFIRDLLIDENGRIYAFTDNRIAYTDNLGKKWKRITVETEKIKNKNMQYVDSVLYNNVPNVSYLDRSMFHTDYFIKKNPLPSGHSADYNESGVFILDNDVLVKTNVTMPLGLFVENKVLYGFNVFNTKLKLLQLSDDFKKTNFYTNGNLAGSKNAVQYFIDSIKKDYFILDSYAQFQRIYDLTSDTIESLAISPSLLNPVLKKSKNINSILRNNFSGMKSRDFNFNWDPENLVYEYSDGFLDSLYYSIFDVNGDFYEIKPSIFFISTITEEIISNKYKEDTTAMILRKKSAWQNIDVSKNVPFEIKISANAVSMALSEKLITTVVNPELKTRSSYWYKNIDKKKRFKLEFVIGNEEKNDLLYYPSDIALYNDGILIEITFYNDVISYRELYKIPSLIKNN
ncbi:MAG: hypothetical protein A2015_04435 [Spirochaetes bacterium GWF1_31_7]|nr:MAG: hypothetical protein A2Y30_16835 [Spirochaetes bacterium GWE1_32_154]OHD51598.1 MAG: hypothetical protein A2Y29_07580 [Spirochaetes bacterium GWE2_31_10]OHD52968.1 MAG: hypothetical protein A2015_04435 [Spirochaetes bacterium GWF1_31_7]HBD93712.1 hypothetical protein [Spirochaetia bacterium]HBI37216.1 hypothetical protein [Spirochaetia bacterium]